MHKAPVSLNSFPVFIPNTSLYIYILYFSQLDNQLDSLKDQVLPSTFGTSPLWRVSHFTPIYHPCLKTLLILQDCLQDTVCGRSTVTWELTFLWRSVALSTLLIRAQREFLLVTKSFVYLSYS